MKTAAILTTIASLLMAAPASVAQDVRITTFKGESTYTLNGQTFRVTRNQDTSATLPAPFNLTSRPCPTDCIQPMLAAPNVETLAELEVLRFLETLVSNGTGLLVDARSPQNYSQAAIPGAVNIPIETLSAENRFRKDIFRALGAIDGADGMMDFSAAMSLAIYGDGNWSSTAGDAVRLLIDAGYPADKLYYYRGGLQAWVHLGLSVQNSSNPG